MASCVKEKLVLCLTLMFVVVIPDTMARKHHLSLEDDDRKQITLSNFGLLKQGSLAVNVSSFNVANDEQDLGKLSNLMYGFTLDVSNSSGVGSYMEENVETCILNTTGEEEEMPEDLSRIVFKMDFANKQLLIQRQGYSLRNLVIVTDDLSYPSSQRVRRFSSMLSDSLILTDRSRREAGQVTEDKPNVTDGVTIKPDGTKESTKQEQSEEVAPLPLLTRIPMNITDDDTQDYSFYFRVLVSSAIEEGMYSLHFHNCYNLEKKKQESQVNLVIGIEEQNGDNYLSAGSMPLPTLYFLLCLVYLLMAIVWNTVLCKSSEAVYKMHYLMLVVVFVKSLACLFHAINYHFIKIYGIHEEAWAVLYYIAYLTRGALLFITIVLIGSGWAFIKHMLSDREKRLFLIFIPLQVLDNIAWIIVEESEEGQSRYTVWKEMFILIDLLCCGAILLPVVWSIRHLQEASRADGKAELSLTKLKLFRQFYILIVCYIYSTRIVVYLLKMTVPFKYEWLNELFRELATILFFFVTGYKFRPAPDNPYLQVPSDEEEDIEMDEVIVGQNKALDTLKRVNQAGKEEQTIPKLRESSHEYD